MRVCFFACGTLVLRVLRAFLLGLSIDDDEAFAVVVGGGGAGAGGGGAGTVFVAVFVVGVSAAVIVVAAAAASAAAAVMVGRANHLMVMVVEVFFDSVFPCSSCFVVCICLSKKHGISLRWNFLVVW